MPPNATGRPHLGGRPATYSDLEPRSAEEPGHGHRHGAHARSQRLPVQAVLEDGALLARDQPPEDGTRLPSWCSPKPASAKPFRCSKLVIPQTSDTLARRLRATGELDVHASVRVETCIGMYLLYTACTGLTRRWLACDQPPYRRPRRRMPVDECFTGVRETLVVTILVITVLVITILVITI